MAQGEAVAVLKRKTRGSGRSDPGPLAAPARVLRAELPRAAEAALSLRLSVTSVATAPETRADVLAVVPEGALLSVLAGPDGDCGLAALDPSLSAAIVEVQTTGAVALAAPSERSPTETDAALAAPFLDHALAALGTALADEPTAGWCRGYHYESRAPDTRTLGFLLEDTAFHGLVVSVGLGAGPRTGSLLLAFPARSRRERDAATAAAAAAAAGPDTWCARFGAAVRASEARLEAVLTRVRLPLSRVSALTAGDVVLLPEASLDGVRLEGSDGTPLGTGRLGQWRGHRAVRLATVRGEEGPAEADAGFHAARAPEALGIEAAAEAPGEPACDGNSADRGVARRSDGE